MNILKNKTAVIGIAAALIIILGAGVAFLYSQNKPAEETSTSTTTTTVGNESESNDLIGLLKLGKTQQCNFSYEDENGSSKGVVYISSNQLRSDLTITDKEGKEMDIYMIRTGDDNYVWGSSFPKNTGIKMTMDLEKLASDSATNQYVNPSQKMNYSCSGWTVDASVFTPPAGVKFSDFSQFMQGTIKNAVTSKVPTPAGNTTSCDICNSLTGDAKNVCLQQLNCQ